MTPALKIIESTRGDNARLLNSQEVTEWCEARRMEDEIESLLRLQALARMV